MGEKIKNFYKTSTKIAVNCFLTASDEISKIPLL